MENKNQTNLTFSAGFTLAEVLITLGVIGVVAAITIPSLIENYQTRVRSEQNRMVQYKLTQATDLMKSQGKIGNYATTKDFVNELKKYFKIAQVCENDNLEQCWPTKVISTNGTEINVADIKNGKNMNPKGWTKATLGIVTADGTPMILTYKDNCPPLEAEKTYSWGVEDNKPVTNATTSCIAAIYDLNGKSRPNKSGADVRLFNASMLGKAGIQCEDPYNIGICLMMNDLSFDALKFGSEEYNDFLKKNNIEPCPAGSEQNCTPDYWAGALKTCMDAGGSLPTMQQLIKITAKVYKDDTITGAYSNYFDKILDVNNKLNIPASAYYWSDELKSDSKNRGNERFFGDKASGYGWYDRSHHFIRARCVGNSS